MIISLTGFMGCGKSSVGRRLSELLCCRFMDLDEFIMEREGRSIPDIFASDGEKGFREIEKTALCSVISADSVMLNAPLAPSHFVGPSPYAGVRKCQFRKTASPNEFAEMYLPQHSHTPQETHSYEDVIILSLGGGTVMTQECAEMVQENSVCVYLRASVDTLVRNLQSEAEGRPMLSGGEDLRTRIEELMTLRSATYENVAHEIIDTDGLTVDQIADRIYKSIAD